MYIINLKIAAKFSLSSLITPCFILFFLISFPSELLGWTLFKNSIDETLIIEGKNLPSLPSHMIFWEWSKNHATIHTDRHLITHAITSKFGYRHFYSPHWMVGVGAQFKSFRTLEDQKQLSYLSIFHEVYRLVRIYHPLYFCFGFKGFYLLPTVASKLPIQRRRDFENDIGAGLSIGTIIRISSKFNIQIFGDRWRGTKNNELHAYEAAGGFSYSID